jgi:protein-S-isoprenylcysteine O-methyltransferase Ste14
MSLAVSAVLAVTGITCFSAFVWGVKSHFRKTQRIPDGTKLISVLSTAGFLSFITHLTLGHPGVAWGFALLLFVASLALFAWTVESTRRTPPTLAFDDDKPSFLLHQGPYRYVRHPFYLSYLMYWVGTAIAFDGALSWVIPVSLIAVYTQAATREEQKFAQSELAKAYECYRARAGMFLPRLSGLVQSEC